MNEVKEPAGKSDGPTSVTDEGLTITTNDSPTGTTSDGPKSATSDGPMGTTSDGPTGTSSDATADEAADRQPTALAGRPHDQSAFSRPGGKVVSPTSEKAERQTGETGGSSGPADRKRSFVALAALIGVVLFAGGGLWWYRGILEQEALEKQKQEEAQAQAKLERAKADTANAIARDEDAIEAALVDTAATPTPSVAACGNLGIRCPDGFTCTPEGRCETDGMVLIPGGPFKMGCDVTVGKPCGADEVPIHTVTLSTYAIDRTEVTAGDYRKCMDTGACDAPVNTMDSRPCNVDLEGRDEYPVNCVDWERASRYCVWAGKRLPTEAEWEKAARGTDERWYPWGSKPPDCTRGNIFHKLRGCVGDTARVGGYPAGASPYGVQDMLGNVLEWVRDYYNAHYYYDANDQDPSGPLSGDHRVLRGSSYGDTSQAGHHASARYHLPPSTAGSHIGFRCVSPSP